MPRQRRGVGAPGRGRIGREQAVLHRPQARHRKPLGALQHLPGLGLAITPPRPGAGIEQAPRRRRGRSAPAPARRDRHRRATSAARSIAAGGKMPPAAVIGDREIGIAPAGDRRRRGRRPRRGGRDRAGNAGSRRARPRRSTIAQRSRTAAALSSAAAARAIVIRRGHGP